MVADTIRLIGFLREFRYADCVWTPHCGVYTVDKLHSFSESLSPKIFFQSDGGPRNPATESGLTCSRRESRHAPLNIAQEPLTRISSDRPPFVLLIIDPKLMSLFVNHRHFIELTFTETPLPESLVTNKRLLLRVADIGNRCSRFGRCPRCSRQSILRDKILP